MVVFAHAVAALSHLGLWGENIKHLSPVLSVGTVFFVMVAGLFFVTFPENNNYFEYLKSKARFVLAPYLITSLPAALLFVFHLRHDHRWLNLDWLYSLKPLEIYAYLIFTGAHLGPLWFIPMIVIFYLLNPIWRYLVKTGYVYPAFLAAAALGVYVHRPDDNSNVLQSALYFLAPYLFGMCVGINIGKVVAYARHSRWGLPLALLLVIFAGQFKDFAWSLPAAMILSLMLLLFCADKLNKRVKILNMFARLSFYIYFTHGYVIGAFAYLLANHRHSAPPMLTAIIIFAATLAICILAFVPLKLMLKSHSKTILAA